MKKIRGQKSRDTSSLKAVQQPNVLPNVQLLISVSVNVRHQEMFACFCLQKQISLEKTFFPR